MNAEEQRIDQIVPRSKLPLSDGCLPPTMALPQQLSRMFTLRRVLGLRQFVVAAVGDHAYPLIFTHDFINLDAHFGIRSHPLDLFAEGRQDEKVASIVGEGNGHYVRWLSSAQPSLPSEVRDRISVHSFSVISLVTLGLPLLILWEPVLLSGESDFISRFFAADGLPENK
jgi:hypothetical protein